MMTNSYSIAKPKEIRLCVTRQKKQQALGIILMYSDLQFVLNERMLAAFELAST